MLGMPFQQYSVHFSWNPFYLCVTGEIEFCYIYKQNVLLKVASDIYSNNMLFEAFKYD